MGNILNAQQVTSETSLSRQFAALELMIKFITTEEDIKT